MVSKVGVCYGMVADNLPPPEEVVNLLKSYNIGKVRVFNAHHSTLKALENTDIELIVGVANEELEKISQDQEAANGWINDNVLQFYPATNIKYIAVGNEILADGQFAQFLVPAMTNIQTALVSANLNNSIKVSTTHASSVLGNSYPPSQGAFRDDVKDTMKSILDFLKQKGAPFMANVYPYFAYVGDKADVPLDYALFKSSTPVVKDGRLLYMNLFDAMVDSVIAAMEELGYDDIPVIVTESGWPSGGSEEAANVENASAYNNNLIKHVLSNDGTPKRSQKPIETYVFALFNENLKGGADTERHFGLFYADKNPVYPIDF